METINSQLFNTKGKAGGESRTQVTWTWLKGPEHPGGRFFERASEEFIVSAVFYGLETAF